MQTLATLAPSPPTFFQACCTRKVLLVAAIDWAAVVAWFVSVNWVGVVGVMVGVGLTATLGVLNIISHVNSKRIEWHLQWQKAEENSFQAKLEESERKRQGVEAQATAERAEMLRKLTDTEADRERSRQDMAAINDSIRRERESIHSQRREMQEALALHMNESASLREDLLAARKDLAAARTQADAMAAELAALKQGAHRQATATEKVVEQVVKMTAAVHESSDAIPTFPAPPASPGPPTS